jgi:hypothetical protein
MELFHFYSFLLDLLASNFKKKTFCHFLRDYLHQILHFLVTLMIYFDKFHYIYILESLRRHKLCQGLGGVE